MNDNYATQIVSNLEQAGQSKDYIIGFLTATIDGLRHIDSTAQIEKYLKRSIEQSKTTR